MININLDVNKIDKKRLFKGEKGTYLDLVLIETPNSQYGHDYMVVQSVSKEEREQGIKGNILGNAKEFKKDSNYQNNSTSGDSESLETDNLPF